MEGEGSVGIIGVADPDVIDGLGVLQPLLHSVVRQPDLVPLVDPVEVGGVVQAHVALWYSTQVLRIKILIIGVLKDSLNILAKLFLYAKIGQKQLEGRAVSEFGTKNVHYFRKQNF